MVSKVALLGTLLLASSALAVNVHSSQPEAPLDHHDLNRRLHLKSPAHGDADEPSELHWTQTMAGSILTGEFFDSIAATFTVPHLDGSDGIVLITMGLDRGGCQTGSLTVGVQGQISSNVTTWNAWCQWLPEPRVDLNATMGADNVITVTVSAFNTRAGVVILENQTTGIRLHAFNTTESNSLCQMSAGWTIEATLDQRGQHVPLANFSSITFTAAMATAVDSNDTYHPSGPSTYTLYSIQYDEFYGLTSVNFDGDDLLVQYG